MIPIRATQPFAILLLMIAASSCSNPKVVENEKAFTLSDSMMKTTTLDTVKSREVWNEIRFFGKITDDNNKTAQVFPVVSGVVKTINVGLGEYVKQGQVLASIQSMEVASFQKEQMDAVNNLAIAEKNIQTARDLYEGKLTSEKEFITAEKELEKAKAELDRINQVYKIYSINKGSIMNIIAPRSGFIITKKINQNELLRADSDDPIFSIADIKEVWAVANVNESDISKIREGYTASVETIAFPDRPFEGKIEKIYNVIDPETQSMKFRVRIPNEPFNLKPEMNCTVTVSYSENKSMLAVPTSAVLFDKSKYWVMVFKDRHNIETRQVEIYRQLGKTSYVSAGLEAGELVLTSNALLIYDAINE